MKKILITFYLVIITSTFINASKKTYFLNNFLEGDTLKIKLDSTIDTLKIDSLKTAPVDSTKKTPKTMLTPLASNQLLDENFDGNILKKTGLNYFDYKYTGNFFSYTPFGFARDLGSPGQPNEVMIYGQGFNNSTYLVDGINITNRLTNTFDLNLFQSENIGEIEILPLTRGFLYGSNNNPVAVNFVPADFKIDKPYTRIRFFQAANQEGFIDGMFNSTFSKKLGVFVEITNHSSSYNYKNSDYGGWTASTRFRYLLSDKINFIADYRYANTNTRLNGGVDYDSILAVNPASQANDILYSNLEAPVNYINRYQKVTMHNFSFKTLADFIPGSPSSLTVYYQTNLNEFRQNDSTYKLNLQNRIASITDNNRYKTIGAKFDQNINTEFADLNAIASYEQNTFTSPLLWEELKQKNYSLAVKADLKLFNESIIPSVFGKYLNYDNTDYSGLGADLFFKLNDNIKFYAGYSEYKKPGNVYVYTGSSEKQKNKRIEIKAFFQNEFLNVSSGFFSQSCFHSPIPVIVNNINEDTGIHQYAGFFTNKDIFLKGINVNFDLKIWKILFSSNSSFYFSDSDIDELGIPKITSNGGIYYIDTLFNSDLHLKTGINYWSVGGRNNLLIDFEKSISTPYVTTIAPNIRSYPHIPTDTYSPSFQLDFFLAGEIRERAIVYFTFENLLNAQYFIVPYYPMHERSIRFGVAWEFLD